jgi:heme/copper-type cytochrome/quinol oxidase subunit 3
MQERAQVIGGSVLLVLFGLAFLNLSSYVVHGEHFGPGTHAYGAVYFAMNILMGSTVALALVTTLVTLVRFLGGQVSAAEPALAWSTAALWWTAGVGWLFLYAAVYVVK